MGVEKIKMASDLQSKLIDDFGPINRGLCAAMRNKEYFEFLRDVVVHMNPIVFDIYSEWPKTDTYFFDKVWKTNAIGNNWKKICALYERGYLPLRVIPPLDSEKTREQLESEQLLNYAKILHPPPETPEEDFLSLINFFGTRRVSDVDNDFTALHDMLWVSCVRLGAYHNKEDMESHKKDPRQAIEARDQRVKKIKDLFSRGQSQFVNSASLAMSERLLDPKRATKVPFYAGNDWNSIDCITKGFPSSGLLTFVGGTGGGKTLFLSSIVANHCLEAYVRGEEPPTIWGYIGEDDVEEYTRRIVVNIMNRQAKELGIEKFNRDEITDKMLADDEFRATAMEIVEAMLRNCEWIRAPTKVEEAMKFTTESLLQAFEVRIDAGAKKPRFIVLDYLNLMYLSRENGGKTRAEELSKLAHLLDEWGGHHNITIITAVQASITGIVQARDMRFFEIEDLHESKSVAHHSRMVISIMPFTEYSSKADVKPRKMGIKILKNRYGEKGLHFVSDLDEGANVTIDNSALLPEQEWQQYKNDILSHRAELHGGEVDQGFGKGKGGGRGKSGGGQRKPFVREGKSGGKDSGQGEDPALNIKDYGEI